MHRLSGQRKLFRLLRYAKIGNKMIKSGAPSGEPLFYFFFDFARYAA